MSLGLTELTTLSLALAGAAFVGHGLMQMWKPHRAQNRATGDDMEKRIAALIEQTEARVAGLVTDLAAGMDARHKQGTDAVRHDIAAMKSELDWLTGERMIDQAIAMARSGLSAEDISADLGLSLEAAQTIRAVRRH